MLITPSGGLVMRRLFSCWLVILAASAAPAGPAAESDGPSDEMLLRRARVPADDAGLLEFFRKRVAGAAGEVAGARAALGVRDGKLDPALAAALDDREPARRAAAALVLGRYGTSEQRAAVRRLLTDREAKVRLRAAQGLLAARDGTAL